MQGVVIGTVYVVYPLDRIVLVTCCCCCCCSAGVGKGVATGSVPVQPPEQKYNVVDTSEVVVTGYAVDPEVRV